MAGDWLKMEANTPEKSEVLEITARMGWDDADLTVGKLFRLWRWFDQHTVDGNAPRVTASLLDRIVGVNGFCIAVQESGWLLINEDGVSLPQFDRHNGMTAKNRALTAKRVAKHKINNAEGNAASVTQPLPREEKRREEKIEAITPSSPSQGKAAKKSRIPDPFIVTSDMRSWASDRAPAVDWRIETEKFTNYWRSEAKTKADWPATWRNWILKAQQDSERRPAYQGGSQNKQQQIEDANNAVVREIAEREQRRRQAEQGMPPQGDFISTGDLIIEGEYRHA